MPTTKTDRKAAAAKAAATRAANRAAKQAAAEQATRDQQAADAAAIANVTAFLDADAAIKASGTAPVAPLTSTALALVPAEPAAETAETETAETPSKREHYHRARGVSAAHYAGLSSYFNSDRKTAIPVGNTKYAVTLAQLTSRGLGLHTALRNAYGDATFPARGLDNAIVARLLSAKLIEHVSGGTFGLRDGVRYQFDGAEPVILGLTDLGQTYGAK